MNLTLLTRLSVLLATTAFGVMSAFSADEATPSQYPILAATDTEALMAKDGQKVIVWGETTGSGKSGSGTNFVNFKGAEFYLITFKSDLKPFGDAEPSDAYDGKRLAVTGVVSVYKGKPQIKLTEPDQVRVLAEDEPWPKPMTKAETAAAATEEPASKSTAEKPAAEEAPKKKPPVDASKYFK
ncbi:MAG: hypothetical protein KDN19_20025 [Verrucomicrobiae bacterium]|nr:hypothetical protein [Verrucomicrobiae bacterium]